MKNLNQILVLLFTLCLSISATFTCNATSQCPDSAPCCDEYGECGTGAFCLGGCDIRYSYNLTSCMPRPTCKNTTTEFTSTDQLVSVDDYLGNASETDWIYTGYIMEDSDALILAMPNQSTGTVVSSSDYIWYGKITAVLKTSHLKGVVTAFILYSDVEDEIDFEFVGADLFKAQTNFYSQGITNYTNSRNITTANSTFDNYHTYEIDWQQDQITWSVDGVVGRTLNRADTYNATANKYMYPQTPSRVQFSIWPAGASSSAIGTIDWAGGDIDWNAPDLTNPGYYYAILKSVTVECYETPSGTELIGSKAYIYNSTAGDGDNIEITNDQTVLGSLEAVGFDPELGASTSSSSVSSSSSSSSSSGSSSSGKSSKIASSSSSSSSSSEAASVPTGVGAGQGSNNGGSEESSSATTSTATSTATGFVQNASKSSSASSTVSAKSSSGAAASVGNGIFMSGLSIMLSIFV